jgi:hypothetical protein
MEEATELAFVSGKDAGFCYADNHFWYTNYKGLLKYDPVNVIEEQVFVLQNGDPYGGIYYLGEPYVTYDYGDGIWLTMDEPKEWYYRKYSISQDKIIDSIKVNNLPTHNVFRTAYDSNKDALVLFESYTSFHPNIHIYDLSTHHVETINLNLKEYDFDEYSSINIDQIFIDPQGKIYMTLLIYDLNDKKYYHLYICNNTTDFDLIQIYKFPDFYKFSGRLSSYNNQVFTNYSSVQPTYGGKVFKLVF